MSATLPRTIEPETDQLQEFLGAEIKGTIHMVNLLRFREDGGREDYMRYAKAVVPCLDRVGARMLSWLDSQVTVIGPDQWDVVLVVEYPSKRAFYELIKDPEYQKIAPIRSKALIDSRLHCTQPASL